MATAHERLVLDDERDRGAEVLHAGGDGDGDGQDVVDEQRAGDGEAGLGAEVGVGDLVVAAAARVGVHVLPVRGDDGEHQHDDRDRDPRAEVVRRHTRDGQDEQHLARRVRHGGERVGGEDGQCDALGQEGLPEPVAAQCAPDQDPFGHVGQFGHAEDPKPSSRPKPTRYRNGWLGRGARRREPGASGLLRGPRTPSPPQDPHVGRTACPRQPVPRGIRHGGDASRHENDEARHELTSPVTGATSSHSEVAWRVMAWSCGRSSDESLPRTACLRAPAPAGRGRRACRSPSPCRVATSSTRSCGRRT